VNGPPEEPHGRAGPGHWSLAASSDAGKGNWFGKRQLVTKKGNAYLWQDFIDRRARSPPSPSGRRVAFTKPGQ